MPVQAQYRVPEGDIAQPPECYRVLSLSGGGFRGLYTARLLSRIEQSQAFGEGPIGSRFDMLAGTSVGGIIAAGLAVGVSAATVYELLAHWGPAIFPKISVRGLKKIFSKKVYSAAPLEKAIEACMNGHARKALNEIDKPLMLTTVSWSLGEIRLLKSRGLARGDASSCTILQAARATSAAPAHFPPIMIEDDWHVDGGLAANCPDVHAMGLAQKRGPQVRMLSVGTTGVTHKSLQSKIPLRGMFWAKPALDLSMQAQERIAQETCRLTLNDRYLHLNSVAQVGHEVLKDLDVANLDTTSALTKLADKRFEELMADPDEVRRLRQILAPSPVV
ncbi:patatin-like phospholipase family protein [Ralstonia pseudosolanacearum]|uniref:patatin-like phospholipase family protein n=1 Tax=Ralstonia pseudosolanacearum TaxID=1310165 RepID=UPI003CF8929A